MSTGHRFIATLIAAGVLAAACQPAPAGPKPKGESSKPAEQASSGRPQPTPTMVVAAPTVKLVDQGKVAAASPAVHVFLWGNSDTTQRDLQLAKDAGFAWVKQRFEWRNIEKTKKNAFEWHEPDRIVDAINKASLGIIARLDNQPAWARRDGIFPQSGPPDQLEDWKDYVEEIAERYKGKIQAYEIWNEPNIANEWGDKSPDPKLYVEMLKLAYTAIKKVDPTALVISAGMSPTTEVSPRVIPSMEYYKQMYALGAGQYYDMLGVHAAGFKAPPQLLPADVARDPALTNNDPSPEAAKRVYAFRHVEDIRDLMVQNGEANKQIAVMEMGWTSDPRPNSPYAWHSVSEQQKGEYLVRALQFAKQSWSPWMGMMTVLYIPEPLWTAQNEQYHWSITNPDGTVRPAYDALKAMPK